MKLINITITCILLLVAACGCDEEPAEAREIVDIDKKYHNGKEVICDSCPHFDNWFNEPNVPKELVHEQEIAIPDITWEREYPITLTLTNSELECVIFEPGEENEIVCDSTKEKYLRVMYESMSGEEPTGEVSMRFAEPNEPVIFFAFTAEPSENNLIWVEANEDGTYDIPPVVYWKNEEGETIELVPKVEPNEPEFNISDTESIITVDSKGKVTINVPTWPDYIELEKDLVFIQPAGKYMNVHKGTKIYFRND